ncbi:MAG TPA: hypothetical protein VFO46_06050 [Candidatus Sulfotelmatobacter sp.]|nr:hypothetical protein [Candidatus Sulfotelmatobacter sp.]
MKNSRMSKLARRRLKNPAAVRLAALKAYRALGTAARQLVKAIIVDGVPVSQALADHKNGVRMWNSRPVIDCLKAYGWQPPVRIRPERPEGPAVPYEPAYPPPEPEQPCAECGAIGNHPQYGSKRLCSPCLCAAMGIHRSVLLEPPPVPVPAAAQEDVHSGPRCPICHLVICGHPRPVVIGGEPRPTHLVASQILPRLADLDYWQREVDADKARRIVANANIDENCQESRILRELARRELNGEY